MTNEVAKRGEQAVTLSDRGVPSQEIIHKDILIPRLLLMQGLSDFVVERKAQQGDFVRSTTGEVMGNPEKPVDFVPLKMETQWRIEEKIGQKFQLRSFEPRTAANDDQAWEFQKNGTDWRRVKVINVFGILPGDISAYAAEMKRVAETGEIPDLGKTLLPVMLSFRSTSFIAGKAVATFFAQVREMLQFNPKVKAYHYYLPIGCYQDKNDKGTYYVPEVKPAKKLLPELVPQAERWYETLNSMKSITVDSDDGDEPAPAEVPVGGRGKSQF